MKYPNLQSISNEQKTITSIRSRTRLRLASEQNAASGKMLEADYEITRRMRAMAKS